MITKERLQELINNCGIVYSIEYDNVEMYELSDEDISLSPNIDYALRVYNCLGSSWFDIKEENLFETKEEAEWHREFGCIERTETLNLPSPDKLGDYHSFATYFLNPLGNAYKLLINFPCNYIGLFEVDNQDVKFLKPATKENYILACKKAKEIFLGE